MRTAVATAAGAAVALFSTAIAIGLRAPFAVAAPIGLAAGAVAAWLLRTRRLLVLEPGAVTRPLAIVSAVATLLALVQLGRLTLYMHDPTRAELSFQPASEWEVRHNCATSYYVAAGAADRTPDFYADSLYSARSDDLATPRKPLMLGPFRIDVFEYPPPFLLLPRAILQVAPEFREFRALWFGQSGLFLLAVMLWIPRFFPPATATRALLWLPLLWLAPSTISVLQKGNMQPMVIASGLLAMGLFERRRFSWGGLVLAFATVSKLYPGMLVVHLLAQRQWRAVAWTAVFMAAFTLASGLDLGAGAYQAFASHLPGLMSGEAFPAFRNPMAIATNMSVPGIVYKLRLFGADGVGFDEMRWAGWLYTLLAIGATVWLARREMRTEEKPLAWIAILVLATFRSPFLPMTYGVFPGVWLLCLLAARFEPTARTVAGFVLLLLPLAFTWPNDWKLDPRALAVWSELVQLLVVGFGLWWVRSSRALSQARPDVVAQHA